jgi:hypothetical protein
LLCVPQERGPAISAASDPDSAASRSSTTTRKRPGRRNPGFTTSQAVGFGRSPTSCFDPEVHPHQRPLHYCSSGNRVIT